MRALMLAAVTSCCTAAAARGEPMPAAVERGAPTAQASHVERRGASPHSWTASIRLNGLAYRGAGAELERDLPEHRVSLV